MKKIHFTSGLLLIITCFVLFTGCKKAAENRIHGTWIVQDVSDVTNPTYEEWTFDSGNNLSINLIIHQDTNVYTYHYIGQYKLKTSKKLEISNFTIGLSSGYNGEWDIAKLTHKTLMIVTGKTGLSFKEFYKN